MCLDLSLSDRFTGLLLPMHGLLKSWVAGLLGEALENPTYSCLFH